MKCVGEAYKTAAALEGGGHQTPCRAINFPPPAPKSFASPPSSPAHTHHYPTILHTHLLHPTSFDYTPCPSKSSPTSLSPAPSSKTPSRSVLSPPRHIFATCLPKANTHVTALVSLFHRRVLPPPRHKGPSAALSVVFVATSSGTTLTSTVTGMVSILAAQSTSCCL